MKNVGFFHPDRGYWQTTSSPPQHIRDSYPEGTIEVPLKPGEGYKWQGGEWVHSPLSAAELIDQIRVKRAPLLSASDWTQLPDSPLSDAEKSAWADYRQALRDLTDVSDLSTVVWPVAPVAGE